MYFCTININVIKMNRYIKVLIAIVVLYIGYSTYLYIKERTTDWGHKVVICVPVYGQSLALGEEAIRITDFDSLRIKYDGRIVTENLDYEFGYYDEYLIKQILKRLLHYRKRSFELSIYRMAENLTYKLGEDTIICIFPDGRGMSNIGKINKPNKVYLKFLKEIHHAYTKARSRGWEFYVPAVCWMQGESDIIDYTPYNYHELLKEFCTDINQDFKAITHQKEDIPLICYQSNVVTRAVRFDPNDYDCIEMKPAQSIVSLIKNDSLFWASGPTYPYHIVNEKLHIDAKGQQHIGSLQAIAVQNILKGGEKTSGVIPRSISTDRNIISVAFYVPSPPLVIDTISVKAIKHYGFSVITQDGKNILSDISIEGDTVKLVCSQSPKNSKVRYAVNGEKMKSGFERGPRGNLRDSHSLHHWCYQFDIPILMGK